MGGFNERFIQLGGGFANFDFFRRAAEAAREGFVMLLGEGTFHQVHCGATTQAGGVDRKYDGNLSLWDLDGGASAAGVMMTHERAVWHD